MDNPVELNDLYKVADEVSNKLVSCNGCTKCCESGLAYALPEEVDNLTSIGVPLIEIDEIHYIKRTPRGKCSMLDEQHSRCSIYEDRPLCCRIFPLDLFSRDLEGGKKIKPSWGIYNYCPPENVKPIVLKNKRPELDLETISIMSDLIERSLPKKVLNFLFNEDKVTARIELLDNHKDDFLILN